MPVPFSVPEKLRIQFRKSLRKGHVTNAVMEPAVSPRVERTAESGESFIVKVDRTKGGSYWFSDRRLVRDDDSEVRELFRYDAVRKAHWMFKRLWKDPKELMRASQMASFKQDHYDRLEIETREGLTVLENLGQAYWPTLHFLWWITR
jgi:hypothetical protein